VELTEAKVTAKLLGVLRSRFSAAVIFKHWDRQGGVPDVSFTWNGFTTWIEVKLVKDREPSWRGLQDLKLRKLAESGSAFYLIYDQPGDRLAIYQPRVLDEVDEWRAATPVLTGRFSDHGIVADFLRALHRGRT
jgi:hypothetical protein